MEQLPMPARSYFLDRKHCHPAAGHIASLDQPSITVVDGDTAKLSDGGPNVRILRLNSPEVGDHARCPSLDLGELFGDDEALGGREGLDRAALRLEAEARAALPAGADSINVMAVCVR
jgi:hypothetical protein